MKAMCIDESRNFVWQDVEDPVCHGEFCRSVGADVVSNRFKDDLSRSFENFPRHWAISASNKYMKRIIAIATAAAALSVSAMNLDEAEAKARALCAKMTLEEKAGELMVYDYREFGAERWGAYTNLVNRNEIGALMRVQSASETRRLQEYKLAHSRLGIPLIIHEDITHGWVTTLPLQLAMACSWDDAAVEKAEAVAARESAAIGINLTYSPQVDVSDDPRWGRIGATLGEDPYLSGRMAAARVRGYQGRSADDLSDGHHVIACVKHFIGYSSLQGGKDYRHQDFSRRELLETHLPPYRAAIDAGALAVMNAYTAFDGVPCNFSRYLLTDLLRGELGFRGQVITDWTTLQFSVDEGAAEDLSDAALRGLAAGVDMDMISRAFLELPRLVREGKASEVDVDKAVVRSLAMKYVTGLFDDPFRYCDESKAKCELYSERNRRDVLELTRESIVLLKNEGGILPLSTNRVVGLTGTWFDDEDIMRGGMGKDIFSGGDEATVFADGLDASVETLRGAMAKRWGVRLDARPIDMRRIARAEATLPGEDVVVLALGEPTSYTGERRGRARITLPEAELENLRTLKRGGKKIVSVVFAGRPVILDEVAWLSDAVVMAWYPGAMGAEALAEILCGETNPSGKLAQHIPLDVGQIPLSYREKRTFISCAYADIPAKPLYPFGYGLSYTTFSYGKPVDLGNEGGMWRISCEVTNTGTRRGRSRHGDGKRLGCPDVRRERGGYGDRRHRFPAASVRRIPHRKGGEHIGYAVLPPCRLESPEVRRRAPPREARTKHHRPLTRHICRVQLWVRLGVRNDLDHAAPLEFAELFEDGAQIRSPVGEGAPADLVDAVEHESQANALVVQGLLDGGARLLAR